MTIHENVICFVNFISYFIEVLIVLANAYNNVKI